MKPVSAYQDVPGRVRLARFLTRRDFQSQGLFIILAILLIWGSIHVASSNLAESSGKTGFAFLWQKASFELGESLIPYSAGDTYFKAFVVGVLNTLKVAALGIVLSTFIGLIIALGQLSKSVVITRLCRGYVEVVRNIPLLLQLLFWHTFLLRGLPTVRQALSPVDGIYLTNRGLYLVSPVPESSFGIVMAALLVGIILASGLWYWHRKTNAGFRLWPLGLTLTFLPAIIATYVAGAPITWDVPQLTGFNFTGGMTISPEFTAMLLGLSIYTGAFNAEIIRAGILGVSKGQVEAGLSLGLHPGQVMRKIVLPQALRIIIPPISNSYLNLTKESSLGVAIGYPEIVRVANITLAETSQSLECISIIMLIYLILSLITSLILNVMNARSSREER
ncbi:amino acid ABC transporter permease [Sneathiella litorea]|uniref:ABC transporter permease subunit n=1 Tax=Sneathiella litorea TaxID=2606216 RepID=A0A6L8WAW1_9PROT|nr:ABC transporter permease subunit [Sneathiella litorea]MZR32346.1 ABC transporter permease subunit [Sneathiella litorea]